MSLPRSLEEWRGEEATEKGDFQEAPANSAGRGNPCKGAAGSSEGGRVADARGHREGGQTQKQSHRDQLGRKGHHCCSSLLNTKCKGGLKKRKTREGKPPGKAGPAACPSVTRGGRHAFHSGFLSTSDRFTASEPTCLPLSAAVLGRGGASLLPCWPLSWLLPHKRPALVCSPKGLLGRLVGV